MGVIKLGAELTELIKRLSRYSEQCVAYKLEADFADAIQEAIRQLALMQIELNDKEMNYIAAKAELDDCRQQLCMKCGEFKLNHCGECRWKK